MGAWKPSLCGGTMPPESAKKVLDEIRRDGRGEFEFSRVPPGTYALAATLPANAQQLAPIPVAVGANPCITRHVFPERVNQSVVP